MLSLQSLFIAAIADTSSWRSNLPWSELADNLSADAALIDTTPAAYVEECTPEFDKPLGERSNHGLVGQPSGLCLPHLFCAFYNCMADPNQRSNTIEDGIADTRLAPDDVIYSTMNTTVKSWVEDTSNPMYNLPSKVLFPTVANDVVEAIRFAKEHGLQISVKNSGHSYTSASSKGNTLLINMNKYKPYATLSGPIDCGSDSISDELSNQPCKLSLAKNKTAVIKVGGGENWGEVYKSIQEANKVNSDGYKYHAVGGAAATVSPMGWTFSAGLSGTTAGRQFGFGLDQVLQVEMVLPNGMFVKFGPIAWEEIEGFAVPKTLSVTGLCNMNPEAQEEDWDWIECPEDIPFDDLWFAIRGGGGGTWGVVTSIYLQLHDYMPYERVSIRYSACVTEKLNESQARVWDKAAQMFEIKYILDPTSINATEDESNACGWPMGDTSFSCYGEGRGVKFIEHWKNYLSDNRLSLEEGGIPSVYLDDALSCDTTIIEDATIEDMLLAAMNPNSTILKFKDYVESMTLPDTSPYYPGFAIDIPSPGYGATFYDGANVLVPKKWVLENLEIAADLVPPNPYSYRAFGGKTEGSVSDQMNALSDAHRYAGYMIFIPFEMQDDLFSFILPSWYNTSDEDNFPSYLGANHAGINTRGPLKSDWTKPCPLNWAQEERDEKCVPLQEIIWGTKLLSRLERIKEVIDPNYMFDCNGCVGNNRIKSTAGSSAPTPAMNSEGSLAPSEGGKTSESPVSTLLPTIASTASPLSIYLAIVVTVVTAVGFSNH